MVQVFALQIDLGPARERGEPLGQVKGRGAADVVLQVVVQRGLKLGIGLGLGVLFGQPVERVHERLGNEPAAKRSEPAQFVGTLGERSAWARLFPSRSACLMTSALSPSMIGSNPMGSRKPPIVPVFERLGQGVNVDTRQE